MQRPAVVMDTAGRFCFTCCARSWSPPRSGPAGYILRRPRRKPIYAVCGLADLEPVREHAFNFRFLLDA
jgi:hypothetical protein